MVKKSLLYALFLTLAPFPLLSQTTESPKNHDSYMVKKGDCLWNISKKVLKDPKKWPILFAANEAKIRNPNLIFPSQKFAVPVSYTNAEIKEAVKLATAR